ncbi:unnamed protein product [marine sediment metagenome]|uniref:ArnR1-like winged helix-turn-helix domain-containing protein n=1 Tax=marine sediment metagenome TaxID=412755 RepID=X1PXU2_9ZZZZ
MSIVSGPSIITATATPLAPPATKGISNRLGMDYFDVFLHLLALKDLKLVSLIDTIWRLTEAGEKELRKLEAEERLAELPKV